MSSQADSGRSSGFQYYYYEPSLGAAISFIILFILVTAAHTYQLVRTKTWFLIPLVIGGHFQWIGYLCRAISSVQTPDWTREPYIMQTLLLLLAPALFAASIYMELGRIILMVNGEHLALFRRKWLTPLFVFGDIVSIVIQAAGGGVMSGTGANSNEIGSNIIIGGLFVQLFFFGFFVIVAALFERSLKRELSTNTRVLDSPWRKHLWSLYFVSILIFIRSIFRVIEFIQGHDGYLMRHEVYLYIFDATLMLAVMLVSNLIHPSEVQVWITNGWYSTHVFKLKQLRAKSETNSELADGSYGGNRL